MDEEKEPPSKDLRKEHVCQKKACAKLLRWEWTWGLKTLRRLAWQDPRKPSVLLRLDFFHAPFVNIKIYKKADKISTERHRYINPVAISTKKKET